MDKNETESDRVLEAVPSLFIGGPHHLKVLKRVPCERCHFDWLAGRRSGRHWYRAHSKVEGVVIYVSDGFQSWAELGMQYAAKTGLRRIPNPDP